MPRNLVVFDFDWSFVDQDTDRWVFEVLSTPLRRVLQTRKSGGSQCTPDVVNETMADLHAEGFKKEQILDALRMLPLHPAMKRAVLGLKERLADTTFLCLSNSNEIYIGTILEKHSLTNLFSEIITNPAHWDAEHPSLLHIGRRLPATSPPHGCKIGCLANMCKGDELDAWMAANGGWEAWDRVSYVGDGGNDFCPIVRMRKGDWALVRKNMELDGRVKEEGAEKGLKVDVKRWEGAWEVEEIFQTL
ncbi:phosphatase phospho-type [Dioszegia hungarica]|uniref:Phosphatase phospho-type n=1 Tax=Dioszegia hungarica TaxID=4972 RepID=A0AA38LU35_9TREE|nr:phosphatase phospho-type [Dioszegia hungarica]KAI9634169.1 phosphatase phospho-type [Dioszegia hungarica]